MTTRNGLFGILVDDWEKLSQTRSDNTRLLLQQAVHRPDGHAGNRLLDKLFTAVFDRLVYAQIWEDPVVDLKALQVRKTDRMITIASGGCNVLSYLSAQPAEIIAVDLNTHHLALTRLKLAALAGLPGIDEVRQFLGGAIEPDNQRLFALYIADQLSDLDRRYWQRPDWLGRSRTRMFNNNLYRHGVLGRFIGAAHWLAGMHGVSLGEFASIKDPNQQASYFDQHIAPIFKRRLTRWLTRHSALVFGLGIPPAQARLLADECDGDLSAVLTKRLRQLACGFPLQRNYFAMQAFARGYAGCDPDALPLFMQPANHQAIREGTSRVKTVHQSMTEKLAVEPAHSFNAYVLLDAQDWMSDAQLNALWLQITRTARPGARVIFRTAGLPTILPGRVDPKVLAQWRYRRHASESLTREDRSAVYGGFHLYQLPA